MSHLSEGAIDHAPRVLAAAPAHHNSATSGIAPLGMTGLSANTRDSQLPRPADILAGLLTVRDSGRNGRQSSQGWAARREEPPGRAKYPSFCMVTGTRRYRSRRVQSRMICARAARTAQRANPAALVAGQSRLAWRPPWRRSGKRAPRPPRCRAGLLVARRLYPSPADAARPGVHLQSPLLLCRGGLGLDEGRVLVFERLAHPAVPALSE